MSYKELTPFQKAIVESVLDEYQNIPAEGNIKFEFSESFQKWVAQLIKKSERSVWHYINSPLKKVILVAIMISLLAVSAMAVPVIREAIIDFFVEEREAGVYGITFDPEQAATAPHQIEVYYGPVAIPDNFTQIVDERSTAGVSLWWINENGELICFNQCFVPQDATRDTWIGIDADNTIHSTCIIGDFLVEIFTGKDMVTYVWTDNTYIYYADISATLPAQLFENMLYSMTELGTP